MLIRLVAKREFGVPPSGSLQPRKRGTPNRTSPFNAPGLATNRMGTEHRLIFFAFRAPHSALKSPPLPSLAASRTGRLPHMQKEPAPARAGAGLLKVRKQLRVRPTSSWVRQRVSSPRRQASSLRPQASSHRLRPSSFPRPQRVSFLRLRRTSSFPRLRPSGRTW